MLFVGRTLAGRTTNRFVAGNGAGSWWGLTVADGAQTVIEVTSLNADDPAPLAEIPFGPVEPRVGKIPPSRNTMYDCARMYYAVYYSQFPIQHPSVAQ